MQEVEMFGQSIPLATAAGIAAGVLAGEFAGRVAEELGADEQARRIATTLAHGSASAFAGWVVNAVLLDLPGAAAHTVTAAAGATAHGTLQHPAAFARFERQLAAG
jgi:hypothetical protein